MSHQSDDTLYSFTIGPDNLPHQAQRHPQPTSSDHDPSSPVPCAVTPSRPHRPASPATPQQIPQQPRPRVQQHRPVCSGIATAHSPSSQSSPSSVSSASSESTIPSLPRGLRQQHEPSR
jgi:hypothetical protein